MMLFIIFAIVLAVGFLTFAIIMRRRDAAERKAWRSHIKEQALLNDAAVAERRKFVAEAEAANLVKPNEAD